MGVPRVTVLRAPRLDPPLPDAANLPAQNRLIDPDLLDFFIFLFFLSISFLKATTKL